MNRTIKEELLQNRGFVNFDTAQQAVGRAIASYNTLRPHGSCNYHTPEQAHQMAGELGKRWHKSKRRNTEKIQHKELILVPQNKP